MDPREISQSVAEITAEVRCRGDDALLEYTRRWDSVELTPATLRVERETLEEPAEGTPCAQAFRRAAERIRRFHERVMPRTRLFEDEDGVWLGLRWTPIDSVGLYVPGGKASYPSTLAMTAIPAQIARVRRIVVVSPPGPDGEVSPQVLLAARILGLREIYRVGGAQAIAALAFGTASVPRVDKIFGPGNAFVAEAKKQLFGEVGIDLVAGPSEIVVYADESAEPDWVAADLMAQAEHDEDTRITLLASSPAVLERVRESLSSHVKDEPRRATIEAAIERNGTFEVAEDSARAAQRINEIAPEHLSIQVRDPWRTVNRVRNAGAIFVGKESPVAIGDYYAGPNHVLPTGRTARYASCLSVEDFMKRSNLASWGLDFVRRRGADVEDLARWENLPAHATSVRLRREHRPEGSSPPAEEAPAAYQLVDEEAEVKLNQNESPWDVPAEIKEEVARRLGDQPWNRYHQQLPRELLERIAADASVAADGVIAATGSNLLLQWIFTAFGGPGRSVLLPTPSFSLYPLWSEVSSTRMETFPLDEELQYEGPAIARRLRETAPAITLLCLPNNPTGSELETAEVRTVAAAAAEVDGLLVIDEAYREFSPERYDRSDLVRQHDNVILVRTCSKAFSAAGMRLGYLLASPRIAGEVRRFVPPFHLGLFHSVLGEVLWEKKDLFRERIAQLVRERDRLMEELARMSGVKVFPSQANFFLFRLEGAPEVFERLRERGVLVRRLGGDPALMDCLRVNAGTPEENNRFLEALRQVLSSRKES